MSQEKKRLGLYLHIPFCLRKCLYCDFYSAPADAEARSAYARALSRHLAALAERAEGYVVDTVYFGGGTPNLLSPQDFSLILDTLRRHYILQDGVEITAEANPVAADGERLAAMREAGVNRLSLGLQSTHSQELEALGRLHSYATFCDAFSAARRAGFSNISVDLMMGIPHQTPDSLRTSLERVTALSPEHLSVYGLRVEEGTPFARMHLALPDEDSECEMAELVADFLRERGYCHYEISNFAREGFASRHNLRYWLGEAYLGFGPGAHSFFEGVRFETPADTASYLSAVADGRYADLAQNCTRIGGNEQIDEYVMLRMRLAEGVRFADFSHRFGISFEDRYPINPLWVSGGFLTKSPHGVAFTEKGMRVSNAILAEWLDFSKE